MLYGNVESRSDRNGNDCFIIQKFRFHDNYTNDDDNQSISFLFSLLKIFLENFRFYSAVNPESVNSNLKLLRLRELSN